MWQAYDGLFLQTIRISPDAFHFKVFLYESVTQLVECWAFIHKSYERAKLLMNEETLKSRVRLPPDSFFYAVVVVMVTCLSSIILRRMYTQNVYAWT